MLSASNILEYPTKHRESFWSKCHLTVDGIIPCSAFVSTSLLIQIETPHNRLQSTTTALQAFFFSAITAVMTSHPPDTIHTQKGCMTVLDTIFFLNHLHAHS